MAYIPPLNGGRINASFAGNTAGVSMLVSTGTMVLAGGNNVTLSQTTGVNGATISINAAGGTQSLGLYGVGNTTQNSSTTVDARSVSLNGLGGLTVGYSGGSVQLSAPVVSSVSATGALSISTNGGTVSMGVPAFSAGISNIGNTAGTSGTASNQVIFAGGNNITLSQSTDAGGNTISISGPNQTAQTQSNIQAIYDGANSISTGTIRFSNSNGIGFGINGQTITASHNGLTSQSNQALSASNGSFAFQTAGFSNANGVTFGTSAGSIMTASVNTSYAASNHSHGNPTLNLTNLSGTTASASNGLTISLSAAAPGGGAGGAALSAGTQSVSTGTVNFANSNGITFGMSGSNQITASHNGITSQSIQTQGVQTINIGGNTSGATASISSGAMSLYGGNNITLSQNANSVTISGGAGGGGGGIALANSQTTYSSGTANMLVAGGALTIASTTGQKFNFSAPSLSSIVGTNGISISTAGNTISIDGDGLSTLAGGGATLSYFNPQDAYLQVTGQQGNASLHIQPSPAPNVSFDRAVFPVLFTGATGSTASITLSMSLGIFTRTGSSLSLSTSFSTSNAVTHSGTANSSQNIGLKLFTMGATHSISEGQYYIGIWSRTSSGGANASISQMLASQQNSNLGGLWGQAVTGSIQYTRGLGVLSASTTAMPSSIAFSQINGTASIVLRQPVFYFVNGTI